jgi:hypothetical protein
MSLALKALSQWFTPTGFIQPDTPALRKKYAKLRKALEQELNTEAARTLAVRCAHADLIGAEQAHVQADTGAHDWKSHRQSITDLEAAFPELNLTHPTN